MPKPALPKRLQDILRQLENFEASESVAETGTGARREGAGFEVLVSEMWGEFANACKAQGHKVAPIQDERGTVFFKIARGGKVLLVPAKAAEDPVISTYDPSWTRISFRVEDLVANFPGVEEAQERYAPETGKFAADKYENIYKGSSTKFDGTIVLVNKGVLERKVLLEYKTAKSSKGARIDGNAHERLTFQVMQYLEIATLYPRCSMTVLSNGAFVRYKNKYHTNFHIQADRLKCFAWFDMSHLSSLQESYLYLQDLLYWLNHD